MNQRSLVALLKSFESAEWSEREIDGVGESLKWLPIISYKEHCFGLTADGIWRGEYSDQCRVTQQDFFIAFVSLLELDRVDSIAHISEAIAKVGLPANVIRTFPFDCIMLTALKSSTYWQDLAVKWLDGGYPVSAEIALQLPELKSVVMWQKERIERILNA